MELVAIAVFTACGLTWMVMPQECQKFWQDMGLAIRFSVYCFAVALIIRTVGLGWFDDREGVFPQTFPILVQLGSWIFGLGVLVFTIRIIMKIAFRNPHS